MEKYRNDEDKSDIRKRIVFYIIVLIIIILCLITSCSCTSRYFGRLGDLFRNEEDVIIGGETEKETIRNGELTFDVKHLVMSVSDNNAKIGFSYKKINPTEFTCKTSDASIATCYVSNGYVVVIPKKLGEVTVTLKTETNGKNYEATTTVTITESNKYIVLSKTKGTINLAKSKTKVVGYSLVGITGKVNVTSSDDKIATAKINNGVLTITGKSVGKATITLTVDYNGKTYKADYNLNVINKLYDDDDLKAGTLKSLTVSSGKLTPSFNPNTKNYKVTVDNSVKTITVTAESSENEKVTYIYNNKEYDSFENMPLVVGDNTVNIKVGNNGSYKVIITRNDESKPPIPPVSSDSSLTSLTTNKGKLTPVFNKDTKKYEITLKESDKNITLVAKANDSKAKVTYTFNDKDYEDFNNIPLENGTNTVFITVTAEDGSVTIYTVTINKYYINTPQYEYEISYDSISTEKDILFYTNLFKDKVNVELSSDKKTLTICSIKDKTICVKVSTNSDLIKSLQYTGETTGPSSLPIKVIANNIGSAMIHVEAEANGLKIDEFNITFKIVEKYIVTLKANGGIFNEFTTEYSFKISPEDSPIDLTTYDKPYLVDADNNCLYHEFVGYAKELDDSKTVIYNLTNKKLINYSDLDGDITLVAIYNMEETKDLKTETKTIWLVDVPVFRDQEYYQKYNKEKPIYPGAAGEYTMNFKNESEDTVTIKGMTLKEDTVCVDKDGIKGCLNMGYIIKDALNNYHYGLSNKYDVLNQSASIKDWVANHNETIITFDPATNNDTTIGPKGSANDELEITIHWKWVEYDAYSDKVDTLIGNEAAGMNDKKEVNDLYTLYVGINFDVIRDNCK